MKKLIPLLCLVLCMALVFPTAVFAAESDPAPDAEVYAVVDLNGEFVAEEAPDAALLGASDGYALYVENEAVLSVQSLRGGASTAERFYSADFILPETQIEVFLTGLKAEYVDEIRQRITDSYVRGTSFALSDLGFIDTEKTFDEDDDDELCWAASSADMLTYTGWAQLAGFDNEDDVFEAFITAFENYAGNQFNAMAWFFNGASLGNDDGSFGAMILDYPDSGAYLTDYAFDQVCYISDPVAGFTLSDMDTVAGLLREGWAIGLGVDLHYNFDSFEEYGGGHAVTMWGYAVDNAMDATDPERYLLLFITDSDSDEREGADRRTAPNVMDAYALDASSGDFWFNFDKYTFAQMKDYIALTPYSSEVASETADDATKDKISTADLMIGKVFLDTAETDQQITLFESGSNVSFSCSVYNYGDQSYQGYLYAQAVITDSDGTEIFRNTDIYNYGGLPPYYSSALGYMTADDLAAGDYVMTFTVNPDHSAENVPAEAYFYNNTVSVPFKVRDSYLLGDYDGDGSITVMDATGIQRTLASYTVNVDDIAPVRGDSNGDGLDIMDATAIQRFIADYTMTLPMGEKFLYE